MHPVYRVHRPRGGGGSPVHRGPGSGAGSMPRWSGVCGWLWARLLATRAPRGKGGRGEPLRGRHGNGVRLATSFNGGGYFLSTTRGSGRPETMAGAALDTVEIGRGVGAFYRLGKGGRLAVKE
jgi:hypothetical protein